MLKASTGSGREHRLGSLREVSMLWQAELFANSSFTEVPNHADVQQAASRIRSFVRKTPAIQISLEGKTVWLKLENMQLSGSFKARGAFNALLSLPEEQKPALAMAVSAGNHGLGMCAAAAALEIPAHVVVPHGAAETRVNALLDAGAVVERQGENHAEAECWAEVEAARRGGIFLHSFATPSVIAGQGTVGLEILEQTRGACDAVLVSVGGGGLLSGTAVAMAGSGIRVVGAEPEGAPTMQRALLEGHPVDVSVSTVARAQLGVARTAELNLAIAQRLTEGVVLVSDQAIRAAQETLWEAARQWVEPAGAVALAAFLSGAVQAKEPCIVISGGNSPRP